MTSAEQTPRPDRSPSHPERAKSLAPSIPVPLGLGLIAGVACWLAAGPSLGLYLGGVAMLAILLPPLVAIQQDRLHAAVAAGSTFNGIALVWLLAALGGGSALLAWLQAYVVLAALATLLVGLTWMLVRFARPLIAGAATTTIALLWLAWPLWLSPWLTGQGGERAVARLTRIHPFMAINIALRDLGVWVQTPFMYAHSALGQDVPFELPRGILPCVLSHAAVGIVLLAIARARRFTQPPPELPLEWPPPEAPVEVPVPAGPPARTF
jgi:hypothetical protein